MIYKVWQTRAVRIRSTEKLSQYSSMLSICTQITFLNTWTRTFFFYKFYNACFSYYQLGVIDWSIYGVLSNKELEEDKTAKLNSHFGTKKTILKILIYKNVVQYFQSLTELNKLSLPPFVPSMMMSSVTEKYRAVPPGRNCLVSHTNNTITEQSLP